MFRHKRHNQRQPELRSYRSYQNIDPFEVDDNTDHVLCIDGDIKAQLGTGCQLRSISVNDKDVVLEFDKTYFAAPTEWPVGTLVRLCYYGARLESSPSRGTGELSDIRDIIAFWPALATKEALSMGYNFCVIFVDQDGNGWDILYKTAAVEHILPSREGMLQGRA